VPAPQGHAAAVRMYALDHGRTGEGCNQDNSGIWHARFKVHLEAAEPADSARSALSGSTGGARSHSLAVSSSSDRAAARKPTPSLSLVAASNDGYSSNQGSDCIGNADQRSRCCEPGISPRKFVNARRRPLQRSPLCRLFGVKRTRCARHEVFQV
jgi:hypothetical protein